jgi:hypothetical protein
VRVGGIVSDVSGRDTADKNDSTTETKVGTTQSQQRHGSSGAAGDSKRVKNIGNAAIDVGDDGFGVADPRTSLREFVAVHDDNRLTETRTTRQNAVKFLGRDVLHRQTFTRADLDDQKREIRREA